MKSIWLLVLLALFRLPLSLSFLHFPILHDRDETMEAAPVSRETRIEGSDDFLQISFTVDLN